MSMCVTYPPNVMKYMFCCCCIAVAVAGPHVLHALHCDGEGCKRFGTLVAVQVYTSRACGRPSPVVSPAGRTRAVTRYVAPRQGCPRVNLQVTWTWTRRLTWTHRLNLRVTCSDLPDYSELTHPMRVHDVSPPVGMRQHPQMLNVHSVRAN
ncbi:hypothetical protein JB92DRAFT_800999 [Gautieria morchelliformis]|nr:hypothetical protein JB92DRAFT_800999 [Gautieria morchelliformis]